MSQIQVIGKKMSFKWKTTLILQGTSETDVEERTYPLEDQPRKNSEKKKTVRECIHTRAVRHIRCLSLWDNLALPECWGSRCGMENV